MSGDVVSIFINGERHEAPAAISVAAALLVISAKRQFRLTRRRAEPRGLFCGMGICFDCLVTVDGRPNVRACMTPLTEGMRIEIT